MASIPCSIYLYPSSSLGTTNSSSSSSTALRSVERPRSPFLAIRRSLGWLMASRLRAKVGPCDAGSGTATGHDAEGAGIHGSQSRDDFSRYDVEQYFEHMGMLAAEGSYDKMEALLDQKIHPADILLMTAASEGDKPKMEELLRAGAKYDVRDGEGRTALERAASDEIKQLIVDIVAFHISLIINFLSTTYVTIACHLKIENTGRNCCKRQQELLFTFTTNQQMWSLFNPSSR